MSSKRHLRRRSCEGKIRHPDRSSALQHIRAFGVRRDRDVEPYWCQFCNGWHVGHVTQFDHAGLGHRGRRL